MRPWRGVPCDLGWTMPRLVPPRPRLGGSVTRRTSWPGCFGHLPRRQRSRDNRGRRWEWERPCRSSTAPARPCHHTPNDGIVYQTATQAKRPRGPASCWRPGASRRGRCPTPHGDQRPWYTGPAVASLAPLLCCAPSSPRCV